VVGSDQEEGKAVKGLALLAGLAFSVLVAAAPDEEALGKSKGYPVCPNAKGSFSPEWCLVGVMSHYHQVYPSRVVKKADLPRPLLRAAQEPAVGLDAFLAEHRNTGLLVMKGDTIHAERYQYERTAEHRFASMSMAKTVVALLVGIALQERKIESLDDRAEVYVPDLKGHPYGETPIRHLLTMTSGVKFEEVYSGYDDVMKLGTAILFQQGPGGAAAVLPYRERVAPPGQRWSYASSETFVLALVLRGAVGGDLSEYTSRVLWQPMGAEFDAYWNIDPLGNEVGYCCFSATLRDWARLGLLLADGGTRDGKQVIPADWVKAATSSQAPFSGYGYQTWVSPLGDSFHLRGRRGQAVWVHPATRTVVVHTSVYRIGGSAAAATQGSFFDEVLRTLSK
jgi:CubicO group peptidase (beta-lactamase class C family)